MADRALTEDEVADLKEAFAMFDINGDGGLKREIIDLDTRLEAPQPIFLWLAVCPSNPPMGRPLMHVAWKESLTRKDDG
jgi:hypothetical protein